VPASPESLRVFYQIFFLDTSGARPLIFADLRRKDFFERAIGPFLRFIGLRLTRGINEALGLLGIIGLGSWFAWHPKTHTTAASADNPLCLEIAEIGTVEP
jgi:hypothetical protein